MTRHEACLLQRSCHGRTLGRPSPCRPSALGTLGKAPSHLLSKSLTITRWLAEASRPASPAFKTVRETRRLTRLLSLLPLVTGTQRQGLAACRPCRWTASWQWRCSSSKFDRWLLVRSPSLWCRSSRSSLG